MDVFVHIPKSSGSTIRAILSREYGVRSILYYEPASRDWKHNAGSPLEFLAQQLSKRDIRLITGHHPFGIHAVLKKACRYFSMMRDPIDRVLSDYYYAFSYPHHRFREEIISGLLSVEEFISDARYGHGSEQTRMLAGNIYSSGDVTNLATENVHDSFVIVGIAERFDESILLTAKMLGWKPPIFVKKNVTKLESDRQKERAVFRAKAKELYSKQFESDYTVYGVADDILSDLAESEGKAFQTALAAFREIQLDISNRAEELVFEQYEFQQDDQLPEFAAYVTESAPYRLIQDYLSENSPIKHLSRNNFVGRLDVIEPKKVVGWAGDLSRGHPIHVTIRRSGISLGRVECDIVRDDLLNEGFEMGQMGFKLQLEEPIWNWSECEVCFGDTQIRLPT